MEAIFPQGLGNGFRLIHFHSVPILFQNVGFATIANLIFALVLSLVTMFAVALSLPGLTGNSLALILIVVFGVAYLAIGKFRRRKGE